MSIHSHFKNHTVVHLTWLIVILLAIVSWLLLRQDGGDKINDYISFASSLASLILAVVAIFYAMLSNQEQASAVGTLRDSLSDLDKATKNVHSASSSLAEKADSMIGEVKGFKPAIEELTERISAASFKETDRKNTKNNENPNAKQTIDNVPFGGAVSYYLLAVSIERGEGFNPYNVFENDLIFDSWTTGFLHCIRSNNPWGLKIEFATESENIIFRPANYGSFPFKEIISYVRSEYPDAEELGKIDKYFPKPVKSRSVEPSPSEKEPTGEELSAESKS